MRPDDILRRAHGAARRLPRRFFDPDRDRLASRDPSPDIREHEASWKERLSQGLDLVADAMRRGLPYERCRPHHDLFLKAMDRARAHYVRAARAWAAGNTDHIPVPVADAEPAFDLADALLEELG